MPTDARVIAILEELPDLADAGEQDGRRWFARWNEGAVRLLDDQLSEVNGRALALTDEVRVRAASALDRLVLTAGGDTVLVGDDTVTVAGLSIHAAAFVGDLVVATAPGDDGGHRVLLLDHATGALLDEQAVDADDAMAVVHRHPIDPIAVIELAMGQDGCLALRVDVDVDASGPTGAQLRLTEILSGHDPVIAGFRPAGDRLLMAPYPSDPETARVFAWPSLDEVGRVSAADIDAEYGFGLAACWVDDDRAALVAPEDALVLTGSALDSAVRVDLSRMLGDDAEIESLTPLGPGRIAAGVWTPDGRSTRVIEFAAPRD